MISLVEKLPVISSLTAEYVKIYSLYDSYKNDKNVLFWVQNNNDAVISLADGNMTILNINADIMELGEFISVISPASIFSDYKTLLSLGLSPIEKACVMAKKAEKQNIPKMDELSSKEIYKLLNVEGLLLPAYPFFAVDFCRRLNRGKAKYFAINNICCAVSFNTGSMAIINGVASHQKGFGSIAIKGIEDINEGRDLIACCKEDIEEFYIKNGFKELYFAGYWVKN